MKRDEIERQASEIFNLWNNPDEFLESLRNLSPEVIAAVMAKLASTGETGQKFNALRDSCNAILQSKLSLGIITTMERLDKAATFLAWVGIVLTAMIGIAQIILPLFLKAK